MTLKSLCKIVIASAVCAIVAASIPALAVVKPKVLPATNYTPRQPFASSPKSPIVDDIFFTDKHPKWGVEFFGPGWQDLCGEGNGLASLHCGAGYNADYHYITGRLEDGKEYVTYRPLLAETALYEIWVSHICTPNRTPDARYIIYHNEGKQEYSVNQQRGDERVGNQLTWEKLGTYPFMKGTGTKLKGFIKQYNLERGSSETADAIGFKFIRKLGPYTISGKVSDDTPSAPSPIEGVTIKPTGINAVQTDADGDYSFKVPYWWSGTVTPSKEGYTFDPTSSTLTNVKANATLNFTATATEP